MYGRSVGRAVATGRDERGDKGKGRGYRTRRCMHGSNRRTDRDTERDRWRETALKTLRRRGRNANGRRRLNLTIIVGPISHPDIDLIDRYPEIRISIHNTTQDRTKLFISSSKSYHNILLKCPARYVEFHLPPSLYND